MVPWTTVPFLSSMVTVSLFSFIKNLQRNPKSTTKLGEERRGLNRTEERRKGKRGATPNKRRERTGTLPDELHLAGPGGGTETEGGGGGGAQAWRKPAELRCWFSRSGRSKP